MRTSNPALPSNIFSGFGRVNQVSDTMTMQGVVYKTLLLLLFVLLSGGFVWNKFMHAGNNAAAVSGWITVGALGGFIVALATTFKPTWSPITAPIYAVLEGLFIGGISAMFEANYPGIVLQAACLTLTTMTAMLIAYQTGLIPVTQQFRMGVVAATGGIAIFYVIAMLLGFFGIQIPYLFSNGIIGIGFNLFVVAIAALNFVLDFDFIYQGERVGAPKYMEWYSSFALMVTLIWLYIEFLRLLSKFRER